MTDSHWRRQARSYIAEIDATLPKDASLEDRKRALHGQNPFGDTSWPTKCWQKERLIYLGKFGYRGRGKKAPHLSPLERMMHRANKEKPNV